MAPSCFQEVQHVRHSHEIKDSTRRGGPKRKGLSPSTLYEQLEYNLGPIEATKLLEDFNTAQDHVFIKCRFSNLDFTTGENGSLTVEISDVRDGFWAISKDTLAAAREIISMAYRGEAFGDMEKTRKTNPPTRPQVANH